jgi:enoyl-CoA hydratase
MNFKNIAIEKKQNGIWILTIQRPAALNALNTETLAELDVFLSDFSDKSFNEARVLVVTGAGEKAFVAGADIKEMSELNDSQAAHFSETGQAVFRKIENLKFPVIAAVNGFALGGGLELALSCDFI